MHKNNIPHTIMCMTHTNIHIKKCMCVKVKLKRCQFFVYTVIPNVKSIHYEIFDLRGGIESDEINPQKF